MIIYQASKRQFLHHALRDDIEDVVSRHYRSATGHGVGRPDKRIDFVITGEDFAARTEVVPRRFSMFKRVRTTAVLAREQALSTQTRGSSRSIRRNRAETSCGRDTGRGAA